ncbi:MAG: hypothetical protein WBL20_08130 [Sphingobium sp.]|uniref:hypothetical protein n=1 Tax=Sphingobium sp. TaxID=1912891 RepID=UPI003BB0CF2B
MSGEAFLPSDPAPACACRTPCPDGLPDHDYRPGDAISWSRCRPGDRLAPHLENPDVND